MELLLIKFINENENWEELLTKDPYNLKITREPANHEGCEYIMFKYNQLSSDFSNPIVRECRGLILYKYMFDDRVYYRPICAPFFKFANAEESYSDLAVMDWASASVQEKVDGSLMKVWFESVGHTMHVSTNGTIDASKAQVGEALTETTFLDLFNEGLDAVAKEKNITNTYDWEPKYSWFETKLDRNYTYMFELVSPKSRVVIEYPETKLYFLGARNRETLEEVNIETSEVPSIKFLRETFSIPKRYKLNSYEAVKEAANALPWSEEGYVVCDKYFHRVKIKSPEYVKAHHGRTNGNISLRRLLEIILNNEVDEFLIYANEYTEKINKIITAMETFKANVNKFLVKLNPTSFTNRKDYAVLVKEYPSLYQVFLFRYGKLDETYARLPISSWEKIVKFMIGEIND